MSYAAYLLAAADKVKAAWEAGQAAEREAWLKMNVEMTPAELAALPHYQFSTPTGPKPGFRYRRQYWRLPDGYGGLWQAPNEATVRQAIAAARGASKPYRGELIVVWFVYECELDPENEGMVLHRPREVKLT